MSSDPEMLADSMEYTNHTPKGYMKLMYFFRRNVIEVRFKRKEYPSRRGRGTGHRKPTRRMLCSSNWRFIASPLVKNTFYWKQPKNPPKGYQWYKKRKLLITWDILNQEWRMVHLKDIEVVAAMPIETIFQKAKFVAFYYAVLKKFTKAKDPNGYRRDSFADK